MRALVLEGGFGIDHLSLREVDRPSAGPAQLLLKLSAASLNYRDLLMVRGEYDPKLALPFVPGSDAVGEVVECGAGVSGFQLGDRVCPVVVNGWYQGSPTRRGLRQTRGGPLSGVLQECVAVDAADVVKAPAFLTNEGAATLPCAALTAFSALFRHGQLQPDQSVLVLGTGGVSIFALQFAKALGAQVIITSRSHEKLEKARALGADFLVSTLDYPNWGRRVRELASGDGVDHVLEVGGAGTLEESLQAVRPGGQISLIGVLAGTVGTLNLLPLLMRDVRLQGVFLGHRESFVAMNAFIERHQICPVVDACFELEQSQEAFQHLARGQHFGKVCVRIKRSS